MAPSLGDRVRTRITDDLYFLPLVVHHYVVTTGDTDLLDEVVPFIASPVLREDQEEEFNLPAVSAQTGTVYEHCVRALKYGYRLGSHGLPLMGTGDWNAGMNKVGARESTRSFGWFFVTVNAGSAAGKAANPTMPVGAVSERSAAHRSGGERAGRRGTAAPTSTMGLPGIRPERWARSTPFRKPGPSFPAQQVRREPSRRWMPFKDGWCVPATS